MHEDTGELGAIAQRWFQTMRNCRHDVREILHDGHPTACVGDAAFAYVNAFKEHVNVGFFRGAERDLDAMALTKLIVTAYSDMKGRIQPPYFRDPVLGTFNED